MRSFQKRLPEFEARGVQVAAISIDSPRESRDLSRSQGYTFPILSDPGAKAIRAYGVVHEAAGEGGSDVARPAEFLIDRSGAIRWTNLSESLIVRLWPERALRAIDEMPSAR